MFKSLQIFSYSIHNNQLPFIIKLSKRIFYKTTKISDQKLKPSNFNCYRIYSKISIKNKYPYARVIAFNNFFEFIYNSFNSFL